MANIAMFKFDNFRSVKQWHLEIEVETDRQKHRGVAGEDSTPQYVIDEAEREIFVNLDSDCGDSIYWHLMNYAVRGWGLSLDSEDSDVDDWRDYVRQMEASNAAARQRNDASSQNPSSKAT
jgi:hypothetical protein